MPPKNRVQLLDSKLELTRHLTAEERSELSAITLPAVEVAPVVEVDHRPVKSGAIGPVARQLRRLYYEATRGYLAHYQPWLTRVYRPAIVGKAA